MAELLSIIIPVYNVEEYLPQCIESVLGQTYRELEVILVNDGSTDSSPDICDAYAKKDSRIVVIHKENGGQDSARKAGIRAAHGEYIGYVDSDDWIEPEMYERLMSYASEYDVDVVESGVIDSWEDKHKQRRPFLPEGCFKDKDFREKIAPYIVYSGVFFKHGIFPYLVSKIFRKQTIIGYQLMDEPTNNLVDDVMCTFPCVYNSASLYITHECFYHYRVRGNSTKRNIRKDIYPLVKKYHKEWKSRFSAFADSNIEKQVDHFLMYLLLAKAIGVFDQNDRDNILKPFGSVSKDKRLVLYGAGTVGIHLKSYLDSCGVDTVLWVDKNYEQLQSAYAVSAPSEMCSVDFDCVILAILNADAAESARADLRSMGIADEKIMWIDREYIDDPTGSLEIVLS